MVDGLKLVRIHDIGLASALVYNRFRLVDIEVEMSEKGNFKSGVFVFADMNGELEDTVNKYLENQLEVDPFLFALIFEALERKVKDLGVEIKYE